MLRSVTAGERVLADVSWAASTFPALGAPPPFTSVASGQLREDGAFDLGGATVEQGERFPAKFGRTGFRRNFGFDGVWRGRSYTTKQVEAYAVEEEGGWLVITIIVKYFGEEGA